MNLYAALHTGFPGLVIILPLLLALALPIWAIIDMFKLSSRAGVRLNPIWILIVLFFPLIGSIIYFQLGKKNMLNAKRVFNPDFNRAKRS